MSNGTETTEYYISKIEAELRKPEGDRNEEQYSFWLGQLDKLEAQQSKIRIPKVCALDTPPAQDE